MNMRIVILGAGLLGVQTARELTKENKDVVIVERDQETVRGVANELDCAVVQGDGEDIATLQEAGLAEADWFIAITGSDEANIVACGIVAEHFGKTRTMARVRSDAFSRSLTRGRRFLGVDHILNPDVVMAETIIRFVRAGNPGSVILLKEPGIQLRRFPAHRDMRIPGRRLQEIRSTIGGEFLVPAVVRDSTMTAPDGSFLFDAEDIVYVLGSPSSLIHSFGPATVGKEPIRSILIFGATALSDHVLDLLGVPSITSDSTRSPFAHIVVIEENREMAKRIAVKYPGVEVICREYTDEFLVEHEKIGSFEMVLCLTASQSFNLVMGQLAREAGAGTVLAIVLNDAYMKLEGRIGLDALINEKATVAGAVLDLVRKADIKRLHSFSEGDLELIELKVGKGSAAVGKQIKTLGLPRQILIAFLIHNGRTMVPTGDTIIVDGDSVGVILDKSQIERIEALFGI